MEKKNLYFDGKNKFIDILKEQFNKIEERPFSVCTVSFCDILFIL